MCFHRILLVVLNLFLIISFSGCQEKPAPMGTYSGTLDGYAYYHSDTRALQWEEDILYLTETFLQYEPYLTETCLTFIGNESMLRSSWQSQQDPELRSIFLQEVNSLIPQIPEMSDIQLLFELQRIVAGLSDTHSSVALPETQRFPFAIIPFYEEGEIAFRACTVPVTASEVLFGKLLAINNVPVEEIVERLLPYISCENEYWALYKIANTYKSMLLFLDDLQVTGVVGQNETEAEFLFETESGEKVTITAEAINEDHSNIPELVKHTLYDMSPLMFQHSDLSYWMQELPEDQALYVRFNQMIEREDMPYGEFFYNIMHTIHEDSTLQKLVLDLRGNPGGAMSDKTGGFFQSLNNSGILVYVLTDNGTASAAVWTAANIKQLVENAVLVGTPTGEPPAFCCSRLDFTMPNTGYIFSVPYLYSDIWPGYEGDALQPDVTIYQTLEDLKNGVDTVLTQVLNGLDE